MSQIKIIFNELNLIRHKNEILIKQRDYLLPRLMSGKLSVENKNIIDRYNSGSSDAEHYFEELLKTMEEMKKEQNRHIEEDLPEIYSKELFQAKTNILMDVFIDKSVQGLKVA